jgi:hypothetical protein
MQFRSPCRLSSCRFPIHSANFRSAGTWDPSLLLAPEPQASTTSPGLRNRARASPLKTARSFRPLASGEVHWSHQSLALSRNSRIDPDATPTFHVGPELPLPARKLGLVHHVTVKGGSRRHGGPRGGPSPFRPGHMSGGRRICLASPASPAPPTREMPTSARSRNKRRGHSLFAKRFSVRGSLFLAKMAGEN